MSRWMWRAPVVDRVAKSSRALERETQDPVDSRASRQVRAKRSTVSAISTGGTCARATASVQRAVHRITLPTARSAE